MMASYVTSMLVAMSSIIFFASIATDFPLLAVSGGWRRKWVGGTERENLSPQCNDDHNYSSRKTWILILTDWLWKLHHHVGQLLSIFILCVIVLWKMFSSDPSSKLGHLWQLDPGNHVLTQNWGVIRIKWQSWRDWFMRWCQQQILQAIWLPSMMTEEQLRSSIGIDLKQWTKTGGMSTRSWSKTLWLEAQWNNLTIWIQYIGKNWKKPTDPLLHFEIQTLQMKWRDLC